MGMTVMHPLLYWLGFLVVAIASTAFVTARARAGWRRSTVMALCLFVFWQLAWLDDWLGSRELAAVCEKEGGIHIHRVVELGPEEFGPDGIPLFVNMEKPKKQMISSPRFDLETSQRVVVGPTFTKIEKDTIMIRDSESGQVIAERTFFLATPGGPPRPMEVSLKRCPSPEHIKMRDFIKRTFMKPAAPQTSPGAR